MSSRKRGPDTRAPGPRLREGDADRGARRGREGDADRGARRGRETDADRGARRAAGPAFGWSGRDLLTPYILLAIQSQRAHGYLIEQYLRAMGIAEVQLTTLYRTLRQLEKEGLVRSVWEAQSEGPARRVYTLTDAGRSWLDAGAAFLERYRSAIDAFFGTYSRAKRKERS